MEEWGRTIIECLSDEAAESLLGYLWLFTEWSDSHTMVAKIEELKAVVEGHRRSKMLRVKVERHPKLPTDFWVMIHFPRQNIHGTDWLKETIEKCGWYQTRIEPNNTSEIWIAEATVVPPIAPGGRLFHATRIANVANIEKHGIRLADAGRTWMRRNYHTPRAFFATSLSDAVVFIKSMILGTSADTDARKLSIAELEQWEIYSFDPGTDAFYRDEEMPEALWCEAPIDAARLGKEHDWREAATY
jgi:hypothetical protein